MGELSIIGPLKWPPACNELRLSPVVEKAKAAFIMHYSKSISDDTRYFTKVSLVLDLLCYAEMGSFSRFVI